MSELPLDESANRANSAVRPIRRAIMWWRVGAALVLLMGSLLLSHRISSPFTGWHEWNSAWYSYFARNHLRYGFSYTAGLCTHGATPEPPAEPHRYLSHPPLIAVWVAGSMAVFGENEWACRLVPILSTLASTWLLMIMARGLVRGGPRWASSLLGVLVGVFYVSLPVVAYFGRMIDHVPVVQFFSLLMLHGYLLWNGLYADQTQAKRRGLIWYLLGCVLGIGTGWAAAIMAGLIAAWHGIRTVGGQGGWTRLVVLICAPCLALSVVFAHLLWALNWDASAFGPLFVTRSFGQRPEMPQPLLEWFRILAGFWRMNFTLIGAFAIGGYALAAMICLALPVGNSSVRRLLRSDRLRTPFLLAGMQGLIYVFAFKNQSWIHEYWQFFLAPLVAFSLGSLICAVFMALSRLHVGLAIPVTLALAAAPLLKYSEDYRDSFWANWREYHGRRHIPDEYVEAFEILNDPKQGVERFAPVMTFRNWSAYEDRFGNYVHRYTQPQIAYHADRPLIFEQNLEAILANDAGAVAYILEMNVEDRHRSRVDTMAQELGRRFETRRVGGQFIAFLDRPLSAGETR